MPTRKNPSPSPDSIIERETALGRLVVNALCSADPMLHGSCLHSIVGAAMTLGLVRQDPNIQHMGDYTLPLVRTEKVERVDRWDNQYKEPKR